MLITTERSHLQDILQMPKQTPLVSSLCRHPVNPLIPLLLGSKDIQHFHFYFKSNQICCTYHGSYKRDVVNEGRHNCRHPQDENDAHQILVRWRNELDTITWILHFYKKIPICTYFDYLHQLLTNESEQS